MWPSGPLQTVCFLGFLGLLRLFGFCIIRVMRFWVIMFIRVISVIQDLSVIRVIYLKGVAVTVTVTFSSIVCFVILGLFGRPRVC